MAKETIQDNKNCLFFWKKFLVTSKYIVMYESCLQKELWYRLHLPEKLKSFIELNAVSSKEKWRRFADSPVSHLFLWIPADTDVTAEQRELLQSEEILQLQDKFCDFILCETIKSPYCPSDFARFLTTLQKFWKLGDVAEINSLRCSLNDRELDMWDNFRQYEFGKPFECLFTAALVIYPFLYAPEQLRVFWELKKNCLGLNLK